MGIISRTASGVTTTVKENLRTDEIRDLNRSILAQFRSAFRKPREGRRETFEQAMRRLNLDEQALDDSRLRIEREQRLNAFLAVIAFLFLCGATYSSRPGLHALMSLAVLAYLIVRMIGTDFQGFRLRHRKLIPFRDYLVARKAEINGNDLPPLNEVETVEPQVSMPVDEAPAQPTISRTQLNQTIATGNADLIYDALRTAFAATYERPESDGPQRTLYDASLRLMIATLPLITETRGKLFKGQPFDLDDLLGLLEPSSILSLRAGISPFDGKDVMLTENAKAMTDVFLEALPGYNPEEGRHQTAPEFAEAYGLLLRQWRALTLPDLTA